MKKHLNIALALAAGLIGGMISRYITPPAVMAQNQVPFAKEMRAQNFVLVDGAGKTIATFSPGGVQWRSAETTRGTTTPGHGMGTGSDRVVLLLDADGREIWSAGGSAIRQLSDH
jgi:hypothetical protein